jgi:hypothetical protein
MTDDSQIEIDENAEKEIRANEEKRITKNRTNRNVEDGLLSVASSLRRVCSILETRQSQGLPQTFDDEGGFRMIANKMETLTTIEEIKIAFTRLRNILSTRAFSRELKDSPESLYSLSSALRRLASSFSEMPSKIEDLDRKMEVSHIIGPISEDVDNAASYVRGKAGTLGSHMNS